MSRIARVGYGANISPLAYTDRETGQLTSMPPPPQLALHEFRPTDDGGIEHYIDGKLRASVPADALAEYARIWPDCADLAGELRRPASRSSPAIDADPADDDDADPGDENEEEQDNRAARAPTAGKKKKKKKR